MLSSANICHPIARAEKQNRSTLAMFVNAFRSVPVATPPYQGW